MTTDQYQLTVGDFVVEVVRKDIKHLHIGVYPPDGRVRAAAPRRLDDEAVRLAVISRMGWIRRQQDRFARQARQSEREMVTGESHFVGGRRCRLAVVEQHSRPRVRLLNNGTLELRVRPGTNRDKREAVLHGWYRQLLQQRVPELIAKWEPVLGVCVASWGIKRMKTRWGSCNASARRIWVNLELAKKPDACLEYIVVHEMIHLLERHHNEQFSQWMDRALPQWRLIRDELNWAPLAHEDWDSARRQPSSDALTSIESAGIAQ